jgi:hypothetical protein
MPILGPIRHFFVPTFHANFVPNFRKLLISLIFKKDFSLLRRQMLYPPELRERNKINDLAKLQEVFRKIF